MAHHDYAHEGSRCICVMLYDGLRARIPELIREQKETKCALKPRTGNTFAYIEHHKTRASVVVYCRGNVEKLLAFDGIKFKRNARSTPNFDAYPGHFTISDACELEAAIRCLLQESYRSPPVVLTPDFL